MKVKELIKQLQKLPENYIVVMAKDAEGNGFSPLEEASTGMYEPDSTWSGELVHEIDAEVYKENAVTLWPTN